MWFAIGFSLACGLYCYGLPVDWIVPIFLGSLSFSIAGLFSGMWKRMSLMCLAVSLGFGWCLGYSAWHLETAKNLDGQQVDLTITATDYSWETAYGSAVDGKVELNGKSYRIRTYINDTEPLEPGDTVTGTFRMRYTPGGEESATYHPGKGIFLLGYQRGDAAIYRNTDSGFSAAKLAREIKVRLWELFPENLAPFTQALLLGDSTKLDYEMETTFRVSGIRHIIAVSGLHISILYSLLSAVTFRKRFLTALLGFPVLFLFTGVAGFTPSVTRACIMVCLMILAQLFNKEYDSPTALAFAALMMLIVNPMVITSVSFQLSVGCVAGIQLFNAPISNWLKTLIGDPKGKGIVPVVKRWFISSISVSVSAMSLVTPLCAYYFGNVSLVGVLTNLLTLWIVNLVFNGLVLTCLLSLMSMKLAGGLVTVLCLPIRFVLWISKVLAGLPLASVYTVSPYIMAWLIFVYILLGLFLVKRKHLPIMISATVLGLCLSLMASWLEPLGDELRVTVLDVGQGQSILLQAEGKTFLVDCGGDSDEETADIAAEMLLSQGISQLDGVIVTHCDADHAGGLQNLLTRVAADVILYPATEELILPGENLYPVSEDTQLDIQTGKVRIFAPIGVADSNENSLCVLFTVADCDILITGDRGSLGEMALLSNQLPDVELLIAGHHGSKYSTTEALLEAVRPDYIFISAGADNPYGHPAQEMLDRVEKIGAQVYRTDLHGTLTFRR